MLYSTQENHENQTKDFVLLINRQYFFGTPDIIIGLGFFLNSYIEVPVATCTSSQYFYAAPNTKHNPTAVQISLINKKLNVPLTMYVLEVKIAT